MCNIVKIILVPLTQVRKSFCFRPDPHICSKYARYNYLHCPLPEKHLLLAFDESTDRIL